jgi:hypothetical protein
MSAVDPAPDFRLSRTYGLPFHLEVDAELAAHSADGPPGYPTSASLRAGVAVFDAFARMALVPRRQSATANITSDALITAVTFEPSAMARSRTASTVIEATRRSPLASSSTLAVASPAVMPTTLAGTWLRALILTAASLGRSLRENLRPGLLAARHQSA